MNRLGLFLYYFQDVIDSRSLIICFSSLFEVHLDPFEFVLQMLITHVLGLSVPFFVFRPFYSYSLLSIPFYYSISLFLSHGCVNLRGWIFKYLKEKQPKGKEKMRLLFEYQYLDTIIYSCTNRSMHSKSCIAIFVI